MMKEMEFVKGSRAIACAGAGVNNLSIDRCAEKEKKDFSGHEFAGKTLGVIGHMKNKGMKNYES